MADRVILHADCNNFYASCECIERPELKNVPMAVAGDPENRTGIVLAKNELAKKYGIKTTDTVYAAKRKCPDIVFVPPRHAFYGQISGRVNSIYCGYTELVEPVSIDESYLDVTAVLPYFKLGPREMADELRRRVREEIGITISVGVSFCKVFAKMGSDYKKPDATTVITRDNFRDILWPLPVSDLLFAGRATVQKLNKKHIKTIGDLAQAPPETLRAYLGRQGDMLWRYANGIDDDPVRMYGEKQEIKSVSRGMTFKRDLITEDEVKTGLAALADDVARNLRRHGLKGEVVSIQIRRPDMGIVSRQTTLGRCTNLQHDIQAAAFALMADNWDIGPLNPIRALTVGIAKLVPADEIGGQLSMFGLMPDERGAEDDAERRERLETVMDSLRRKHGGASVTLGYNDNPDIGVTRGESRIDDIRTD